MYFEDRCDLKQLDELDWKAINARNWQGMKEGKQAEFLLEQRFPFALVDRVGVSSTAVHGLVRELFGRYSYQPVVEVLPDWYY